MYYVYLLKGNKGRIYVGLTSNLKLRLQQHNNGETFTTKKMLPVSLVYYEAYRSRKDAVRREKSLKQYGNALGHLKKRAENSLWG